MPSEINGEFVYKKWKEASKNEAFETFRRRFAYASAGAGAIIMLYVSANNKYDDEILGTILATGGAVAGCVLGWHAHLMLPVVALGGSAMGIWKFFRYDC